MNDANGYALEDIAQALIYGAQIYHDGGAAIHINGIINALAEGAEHAGADSPAYGAAYALIELLAPVIQDTYAQHTFDIAPAWRI